MQFYQINKVITLLKAINLDNSYGNNHFFDFENQRQFLIYFQKGFISPSERNKRVQDVKYEFKYAKLKTEYSLELNPIRKDLIDKKNNLNEIYYDLTSDFVQQIKDVEMKYALRSLQLQKPKL